MKKLVLILLFIFLGCLKTQKSGFDFSTPGGFIFGFALFNFTSQLSNGAYTIGGNISGISSGTLNLSYNSASSTVDLSAKTYKISASKGSYTLSLSSIPAGYICTVSNSSGTLSASISNADITCSAVSVSSVYTGNSNWNDYVKNDGSSVFNAAGTACTGSETGGYRACIHGGEIRKVTLTGLSSCTGITASDSLKAFNWICKTDSSGTAAVYSTGLNSGKYLSDLMDFSTPGFLKNSVTVLKDNVSYVTTVSSVWWTNPVVLNNNGISTVSQIHLFNADPGTTLPVNADRTAIVFKTSGPVVLGSSGCGTNPAIGTNTKNFLWIEGNYISPSGANTSGLSITGKFIVVRNFKIQNFAAGSCASPGILLSNAQNSYFEDITVGNGTVAGTNGIDISTSSSYNFFKNVTVFRVSNIGINVSNSPNNVFQNITVMNSTGYGMLITSSLSTSIMNLTVANANNEGLTMNGATNSLLMNGAAINNNPAGATNGGLNFGSTGLSIQNIASSGNQNNNFAMVSASAYVTGVFKGANCYLSASTGIGGGCTNSGSSDFNLGTAGAAFTVSSGGLFTDKVLTDDAVNTADTAGANPNALTLTDWIHFDNPYRGWGVDGTFPSTSSRGAGTGAAAMRIYDWTLKSSDSILRNVTPCPSDISALNNADTNALTHNFSTGTVTMLRNAVEIIGDGIGDDDGFCENNEACIYTPNIGAYQGHGNLVSASQVTSTTKTCPEPGSLNTVKNVILYKYETNGY